MQLTWETVQSQSNQILSDGVFQLQNAPYHALSNVEDTVQGNYLISYDGYPMYIGEARNLKSRLKQHATPNVSTFYKNYLQKRETLDGIPPNIEITGFQCQFIHTPMGRKEIEDFGIVSIPTPLNRSQLGKRDVFQIQSYDDLWGRVQAQIDILLPSGDDAIQLMPLMRWHEIQPGKEAGVYWIEHPNHDLMYIGESSDFKTRFNTQHAKYTRGSALRRWVGVDILGFELKSCTDGRVRCFSAEEDAELNEFLRGCWIRFLPVDFGRYELEEYLIQTYQPSLNRKSK